MNKERNRTKTSDEKLFEKILGISVFTGYIALLLEGFVYLIMLGSSEKLKLLIFTTVMLVLAGLFVLMVVNPAVDYFKNKKRVKRRKIRR